MSRLQNYLRANIGDAQRIGPFLALLQERDANVFLNFAIPDDGVIPAPGAIAALVDEFRRRGRVPRLEYVDSPDVTAALLAAGFLVDNRMALLSLPPGRLVAPPPVAGGEVRDATADPDLRAVAGVLDRAYGEAAATEDSIRRLTSTVDHGGSVVLVRVDGEPAGGGVLSPPREGLGLIWGVGVLPGHRRRGVASAVAQRLSQLAHAADATPFLEVEGPVERRLYERLGYRDADAIVNASLPERIVAGRLILEPVGVLRARQIVAGDLSGVVAAPGWPHEDTVDGLRTVADSDAGLPPHTQPRAWLAWLDGAVVGDCGTLGPPDGDAAVEIGYGLAEPYRGRGLGTELVAAFSHTLLREDGVRRIVAQTHAGNMASRRVLERAGFVPEPPNGPQLRYVRSGPDR